MSSVKVCDNQLSDNQLSVYSTNVNVQFVLCQIKSD